MFFKNILSIGSGNLIAQCISIAAYPIITRLYTPEAFGTFAIYVSIILIIAPTVTMQYDAASILPQNDQEGFCLILIAFCCVLILSFAVFPLGHIINRFAFSEEKLILFFLWVGVVIVGLKQVAQHWVLREKRFAGLAKSAVFESIVDRTVSLLLGIVSGVGFVGLILGRVFGPLVAAVYLIKSSFFQEKRHRPTCQEFSRALVRYRKFPIYSTWAVFINSFSRESTILIMSALFSPVEVGFYGLSVRVMNLPMMSVGDAIAKVFRQRAAEIKGDNLALSTLIKNLENACLSLLLPPILVMMIGGDKVFTFVFGVDWVEAGSYTQVLVFLFLGSFFHRILSSLFDLFEKQEIRLILDTPYLIFRLGSVFLGYYLWGNVYSALVLLLISGLLYFFLSFKILFYLSGVSISSHFQLAMKKAGMVMPMALILLLCKNRMHNDTIFLAVSFAAMLSQYFMFYISDQFIKEKINSILNLMRKTN